MKTSKTSGSPSSKSVNEYYIQCNVCVCHLYEICSQKYTSSIRVVYSSTLYLYMNLNIYNVICLCVCNMSVQMVRIAMSSSDRAVQGTELVMFSCNNMAVEGVGIVRSSSTMAVQGVEMVRGLFS